MSNEKQIAERKLIRCVNAMLPVPAERPVILSGSACHTSGSGPILPTLTKLFQSEGYSSEEIRVHMLIYISFVSARLMEPFLLRFRPEDIVMANQAISLVESLVPRTYIEDITTWTGGKVKREMEYLRGRTVIVRSGTVRLEDMLPVLIEGGRKAGASLIGLFSGDESQLNGLRGLLDIHFPKMPFLRRRQLQLREAIEAYDIVRIMSEHLPSGSVWIPYEDQILIPELMASKPNELTVFMKVLRLVSKINACRLNADSLKSTTSKHLALPGTDAWLEQCRMITSTKADFYCTWRILEPFIADKDVALDDDDKQAVFDAILKKNLNQASSLISFDTSLDRIKLARACSDQLCSRWASAPDVISLTDGKIANYKIFQILRELVREKAIYVKQSRKNEPQYACCDTKYSHHSPLQIPRPKDIDDGKSNKQIWVVDPLTGITQRI